MSLTGVHVNMAEVAILTASTGSLCRYLGIETSSGLQCSTEEPPYVRTSDIHVSIDLRQSLACLTPFYAIFLHVPRNAYMTLSVEVLRALIQRKAEYTFVYR